MKLKIVSSFSLVLCFALLFTSCKKDDSKNIPDPDAEIAAHVDDESQVSSEMDAVALDAGTVIEFDPAFSGNNSVLDNIICDASVEYSTSTNPKTITITYNGSNCGAGRTRTGKIIISMSADYEWKDAGAAINVTFDNLKITRGNKNITLTGTQTITNVSGGLLVHLPVLDSITHTITSNDMSISFDNGTAREWNVAKQRVFTYDNGIIVTVTGLHTEGDETAVAEWGNNRLGIGFITSTTSPIVIKQECNFRITSGQVKHATSTYSATATFGLDATGVTTTCPGAGKYYYKLVWNGSNGNSVNLILPY